MNFQKIDPFIKSPNDYLLQIENYNNVKIIKVIKKGIWTWIKIHLGARLGLFDKNSVQLNEVAKFIFLHKSQIDPQLSRILDMKFTLWNVKHKPNHKISTLDPNFSSGFNIKNNGNFSKWLCEKDKMKERDISDDIIKLLPNCAYTCIRTIVDLPEFYKNQFKDIIKNPSKGNVCKVSLQASRIYSTFSRLKSGYPDLNKMALYLNGECKEGFQELDKLAALGISTDILFYKDHQGNIGIKMNFK